MPLKWQDTFRYALGTTFNPEGKWSLRIGYAYDESPVPNMEMGSPRLPDGRRHWATLGGSYQITDTLGIDLAYAHLFFADLPINKPALGENFGRGNLQGDFDNNVDIMSIQVRFSLM